MITLTILIISLTSAVHSASITSRIVGGDLVYIYQYPYQVSLQKLGKHFCGGSIVSNSIILSAAHCTVGLSTSFLTIRAGSTTHNNGGIILRPKTIINHNQFNDKTMDYDISYIRVTNLIIFTTYVKAIPLAPEDYIPVVGSKVSVTGWGLMTEAGLTMPASLREVDLYIFDHDQCNAIHEVDINDRMICAYREGKDTCQGDSGGPMALDGMLLGVVSWGAGCAREGYPGVYTSVPYFRPWLKQMAGI